MWEPAGECIHCGSRAWWNEEEGEIRFVDPAPDCLCEVEEE